MVVLHLKKHGGDAEKSLVAVPIAPATRRSLAEAAGPDVEGSLGHLANTPTADDGDAGRTASYAPGADGPAGRFRLLRPHARGGLGAVFVALDTELHREVALKQILEKHADDPISRQRFLTEAEVTGNLEHPGVVPVYALGAYEGGRPFYVMRFLKGDSLKESIDRFHAEDALKSDPGARTLARLGLLRRFVAVSDAIGYAHARGILHRDIKPANVVLGQHGETLVVDWGLAKSVGRAEARPDGDERTLVPVSSGGSSETLPGSALGTPAYMSPEQAGGELDRLGPRSEVYSLGATLYCLLTAKPPFEGEALEVVRAVQRGGFLPPRQVNPRVDRALEAVCLKAMAVRPEDRYPSARALAEDVERWMADEPVTAYREPPLRRARRWAKRNRTAVTALAAAVLVALAGTAAVLAVQTQANAELKSANADLYAANARAAEANAELARSKAAVQARYDLAVEAIKAFHTGVSEDFLLKQDQFKELRDRLLKSAQDFYGKLPALLGREADQASRRALAQSNFELAELTGKVGDKEEALKAHRAVLAAREALAAEPGLGPALGVDVARSLLAVGLGLEATGKTEAALAAYERARKAVASPDGAPPADDAARSAFADALLRAGWSLHTTGRDAEALPALEQARDLQSALAAAAPGDNDRQSALALSHYDIGLLLRATGKPAEALRSFEAARAIREKLARDNPAVTQFQSDLAESHHNIGNLLDETGKPAEALQSLEAARAIMERLARDNPAVTQFQSDLAASHCTIGLVLSATGQPAEALRSYEAAGAIFERLARDNPTVTRFPLNLTINHNNIGVLLSATGKPSEALRSHEAARAIFERLARDNPKVPDYLNLVAGCHTDAAVALRRLGRPAEARDACAKAIALREALVREVPEVSWYRSSLAWSLRRRGLARSDLGDLTGAAADARRAIALWDGLPSRTG
jgi:serine/threonine-protein kinase